MKTFSCRVLALVLLAAAAFGTSVQGAPEPVDPVVGNWIWGADMLATFQADGTVHLSQGSNGTWQYLRNPEVQRHYRIIWDHGRTIDEMACSEDGHRAHIRDSDKKQFDARRAIDDKLAATPAPAGSRMAGPAPVPPKPPTAPATTAQSTSTGATDPIVGEWNWLKGIKATFLADGTVKSSAGNRGTWEFLHNPEAERKYHVTLRPGKYTSDLLYDPAAGTARATNTEGRFFDVARTTAETPGKPEGYYGAPGR